jgi:hypothetical protein
MPSRLRTRLAAATFVLALAALPAGAAEGPQDVVRRLGDDVLAVLRDKSISNDTKRTKIEQISVRGVDFETLSKLVLARHWSRFSPEEQKRFENEFRHHLSVTYGKSVDSYKNEEVAITGERDEARGDSHGEDEDRPRRRRRRHPRRLPARQVNGDVEDHRLRRRGREPGLELPLAVPGHPGVEGARPADRPPAREEREGRVDREGPAREGDLSSARPGARARRGRRGADDEPPRPLGVPSRVIDADPRRPRDDCGGRRAVEHAERARTRSRAVQRTVDAERATERAGPRQSRQSGASASARTRAHELQTRERLERADQHGLRDVAGCVTTFTQWCIP